MSVNKSIKPKNDKGDWHGYQELYNSYGDIIYRGYIKNNIRICYTEKHWSRDKQTVFYIR
jgi:hypothetical protein